VVQRAEQPGFLVKARCRLGKLIRVELTLAHLFDGDTAVPILCIYCLVDGAHATTARRANNQVALL